MIGISDLTLIITALGVGGLLGAFAKGLIDKRHLRFSKVFDYKERRYQALAILMWVKANPTEGEFRKLIERRPDLPDVSALERELNLEVHNSLLYASRKVSRRLQAFISDSDLEKYDAVIRAMKKDLYA